MKKSRTPSMATVAEAAGVSLMTVSRVLQHSPNVAPATRTKVEEAIQRTGYRPNPLVATLMAQLKGQRRDSDAGVIAWVSPFSERTVWWPENTTRRVYEGAQARAQHLGFRLEAFHLRERGMTAQRVGKILDARGIRGVIIAPSSSSPGYCSLKLDDFAAATVGYSIWRPKLHRAVNHHHDTMLTAVHSLSRRGCRKIGLYLIEGIDKRVYHTWSSAFLFHQHRISAKRRVPILMHDAWDRGDFERWIKRHKPDALLTIHYPALEWLRALGLRVPQDIGFAHLDLQPSMNGCSGVDQLHEENGAAAVDLVTSQIHRNEYGIPERPMTVMLDGRWVEGETL